MNEIIFPHPACNGFLATEHHGRKPIVIKVSEKCILLSVENLFQVQ